jgi:accessory secretory protein Asp2
VIRDALEELGFTKDQLILSGMSMGTFGAVYYGSVLEPHAIIIGKPLMNLGNVAANEKRLRPGGFPTSLDVLRSNTGGNTAEHAAVLNKRLWERFDKADFSRTEFAISYMYQDDYDADGFPDILEHLKRQKVTVVSKGLEGRHNDNTGGVVNWFMSQYRRIIRTDFGREVSS